MNIKIIVATHKEYAMPQDEMYLPVFVGASTSSFNLPYQRDDEGENISEKNRTYCELTGLYWAYKNLNGDYIGLNHYRRYFKYHGHLLNKKDAEKLLKEYSVILPKKRHYFIETIQSQYEHAHSKEDLQVLKGCIKKIFPNYIGSFDVVMGRKSAHLFNVFIMKKEIFDDYCSFLFSLLGEVEKEIGEKPRLYGYLSERLLDVYLVQNKIDFCELSVYHTESQKWSIKIYKFLKRKFSNV